MQCISSGFPPASGFHSHSRWICGFHQIEKLCLKAVKEVLGVSCSPNFVRDFSLEESVKLGHFSSFFFPSRRIVLGLMTCERCLFCHHQTTEGARSAVYGCGMDTTTLSFLCSAAAIRETMTQRHSQNLRNVCADQTQSRDPNYCGLRANAHV